eukprot:469770_1
MGKASSGDRESQVFQYQIWTKGRNNCGQQLNGNTADLKQLEKVKNLKQKKVKAIRTMNWGATLIIHEDGDISVGGYNKHGQLGIDSDDKKNQKIKQIHYLDFKVKVVSKGIGSSHTFVTKTNDKLYAAGCNEDNQCGVETGSNKHGDWIPVPLNTHIDIQSIATGRTFSIFLDKRGTMYACGKSCEGALGMGFGRTKLSFKYNALTPTVIPTNVKMKAIAAGTYHCVAITIDQQAFAWGRSECGQCGNGQNNKMIFEPTCIETLRKQFIKEVDCGYRHTLLVRSDGVLFATGENDEGQCGNGTTDNIFKPIQIRVGEEESVQSVKCGAYHNALTTMKNKIFVWGRNSYNQCLIDGDQDKVKTPTLYTIPDIFKHRNVQVIPGHNETRVIVWPTEVTALLCCVGLERYVKSFRRDAFETMDDLKDITNEELKEIGVSAMNHRKKIRNEIKEYFAKQEQVNEAIAYHKDDEDYGKDDMKIQDDVPRVENGLVMFFGVGKYQSETYPDLDDIIEDEEHARNVFEKKFNYRFISNGG